MPIRWATLFRLLVLAALSLHEYAMYRLAREIGGLPPGEFNDVSDIVLSGLFALAMMIPLVWAVTLPELPEIYTRVVRAKYWHKRGRCSACGYRIGSSEIHTCPECGHVIAKPKEYVVTSATIGRYVFFNLAAWLIGCTVAEWSLRFVAT